jgi:hypothetical protein
MSLRNHPSFFGITSRGVIVLDRHKYRLAVLIAKYGRDEKLFTWMDELTAECPRKRASDVNDQCGARCPDLPKVVRGPNFADGLGVLEPGAPHRPIPTSA